ncbi:MAG: hypothetical protein ABIJ39_12435, partial [Chloroflexota bacterium]
MKKDIVFQEFMERIKRGRKFEAWERSQWNSKLNSAAESEAPTQWKGKGGRVDIRLKLEENGDVVMALVHKSKSRRNPSIGLEWLGDLPQRGCYVTLGHTQVCDFVESGTT